METALGELLRQEGGGGRGEGSGGGQGAVTAEMVELAQSPGQSEVLGL